MSELSPIGHIRATLQRLFQTGDPLDRAHNAYLTGKLRELELQHSARCTELLAANTAEVERRRNAEHDAGLMRQAAGLWSGAYHEAEAARKALALELRRLHDGQPDGHKRPRPLGLVSAEPVTGD